MLAGDGRYIRQLSSCCGGPLTVSLRMTENELAQRLEERWSCEAAHQSKWVAHNGFGWIGWRCPECGFMFFGQWEPRVGASG